MTKVVSQLKVQCSSSSDSSSIAKALSSVDVVCNIVRHTCPSEVSEKVGNARFQVDELIFIRKSYHS